MNSILVYFKRLLDQQLQSPFYNGREVDRLQQCIFEAHDLNDRYKDNMDKLRVTNLQSRFSGEYAKVLTERRHRSECERNLELLYEKERQEKEKLELLKDQRKHQEYMDKLRDHGNVLQMQIAQKQAPVKTDRRNDLYEFRTHMAERQMEAFMSADRQRAILEMKEALNKQMRDKQEEKERLIAEKKRDRDFAIIASQSAKGEDIKRQETRAKSQQELMDMYEQQIRQKNSSLVVNGYPRYDSEHYCYGKGRRNSPFFRAASNIIA